MHRRGDDPAQRQRDRSRYDRRRHVAFLHDLLAEVERQQLGRDSERGRKHRNAERSEEERVEQGDVGQSINVAATVKIDEASGVGLAVGRQPSKLI